MTSVRWRPKHQVYVLQCYPKFQKNNVEAKPNSSELSYLLYYASTRRSKLQKVADFLDKRTTRDVWKGRIGNVQVTLQILKALIEKCPRDLPLFAAATLSILRTILRSNDITLVEETVPTFESFCTHQDPAALAADQDYLKQYEEIVQLYAAFASKETLTHSKTPISWPVAVRFRKAGLEAIKSVASSDSLSSETGRQLAVIIPVILLNIYSEDGSYLPLLEGREKEKEMLEKELAYKRRHSTSTVRTMETGEGDPNAASGTTEYADKLAEEEVGIVALQGLRHLFMAVSRGQLRQATSSVLEFIASRITPHKHFAPELHPSYDGSWPTTLFGMICGWAPVQDRYTILVTAVETLIRSPIAEDELEKQLVLSTIISWLLSSKINFIGLSVMDVLLGLVKYILLLQLGGQGAGGQPYPQQTDAVGPGEEVKGASDQPGLPRVSSIPKIEIVESPSPTRIQLLDQLERCIASLATHIYYTDQVSDMVSAILKRLRPSPSAGLAISATADDPAAAETAASSTSVQERSNGEGFFSFKTARIRALSTVKSILAVANARRSNGVTSAVPRSQVSISDWEGTQWLLRDPDREVRRAYVGVLLTWLNFEIKGSDLRAVGEPRKHKSDSKDDGNDNQKTAKLSRRAVSNASRRERSPKRARHTFIDLLHLAVYENAHQYAESEPDILLLHLLLATFVQKLGVNSVRSGLPMIFRLQEDALLVESPAAKVGIGSLVHGYLWALSSAFDFDTSVTGREIRSEILRRSSKGLWLQSINVPPLGLDKFDLPATSSQPPTLPRQLTYAEPLKPFENQQSLVERISEGYTKQLSSPSSSPPASPSRSASPGRYVLSPTLNVAPSSRPEDQLPLRVKDQLLAEWSKEACLACTAKDGSSSGSVSGSRTGTNSNSRQLLGSALPPTGNGTDITLATANLRSREAYDSRPQSAAYGLTGGARGSLPSAHRGSVSGTPLSSSSVKSAVRVEDLKRALSGASRPTVQIRDRRSAEHNSEDTGSDSMVSADFSISELSFVTAGGGSTEGDAPSREGSITPKPGESFSVKDADSVPPVPPLPLALKGSTSLSTPRASPECRPRTAPGPSNGAAVGAGPRSRSAKRGSERGRSYSRDRAKAEEGWSPFSRPDFSGLLNAINVDESDRGFGAGRPPY